jgi:hypothetical protein
MKTAFLKSSPKNYEKQGQSRKVSVFLQPRLHSHLFLKIVLETSQMKKKSAERLYSALKGRRQGSKAYLNLKTPATNSVTSECEETLSHPKPNKRKRPSGKRAYMIRRCHTATDVWTDKTLAFGCKGKDRIWCLTAYKLLGVWLCL